MADVVAHALEKLGDKAAKVKDVDGIKAIHLLDAEARRVSQDYIAALAS